MRVLWTHNFDPRLKNSGRFMYLCADGVRELGVDLELFYLGNLRSLRNLFYARKQVRRIASSFDVVHAQFGSACAFATAGVGKVPKVLSLRGSDWYWYRERLNYQAIHSLMAALITRVVIRNYASIITMSLRMKKEVERAYRDVHVLSIPDPVDIQDFKPLHKQCARSELGFPTDNDKWVLFTTLSQTNPIKRVPLALEAVNRANKKMGGVQLRFASDLPHKKMPLFVASCDLVLCTSVYEGWPNSIKEGLACNLPFVSTDVSDLGEIAYQERSCHICPPQPDILGDSICKTLSMANINNLRRHVFKMDLKTTSQRLVDLYQHVTVDNQNQQTSYNRI